MSPSMIYYSVYYNRGGVAVGSAVVWVRPEEDIRMNIGISPSLWPEALIMVEGENRLRFPLLCDYCDGAAVVVDTKLRYALCSRCRVESEREAMG